MPGSAILPPASAGRRRLVRALAIAIGLAMGWLLAEVVVLVAEPQLARTFQYDEELGFRVKPYAHGSNRFGFNDRDYPLEKPAGVYRILFVGDSFGWSGGLEGNYTALIERRFAETLGEGRVEVINTGYSMTHTAEQLASLRRDGLRYQPDLVVLAFYAGNDFMDADPNRRRIALLDTYFDIDVREAGPTFWGRPVVARSRLWPMVSQRLTYVTHAVRGGRPGGEQGMTREAYLEEAGHNMHFYDRRKHTAGEFDARVAHIFGALDAMRELVQGRGAQFGVVIIPADFSASRKRAAMIHERFLMDPQHYDMRLAQKILGTHLHDRGIPHIDLQPVYSARAASRELFLPMDAHWNEAGISVAAEALFDWLSERVLETLRNATRRS